MGICIDLRRSRWSRHLRRRGDIYLLAPHALRAPAPEGRIPRMQPGGHARVAAALVERWGGREVISLRSYVTIRVALAKQVLAEPWEPRHREAYDEIKREFLRETLGRPVQDAEPLPALLRRQAE